MGAVRNHEELSEGERCDFRYTSTPLKAGTNARSQRGLNLLRTYLGVTFSASGLTATLWENVNGKWKDKR